ncbi:MAG: hypothetical protein J5I91_09385 [Bacteroidetes bacterium]|nr:hypothetical protein [Bacteroidota bacterium]
MKTSLTILCLALITISGCKDKEPKITKTYELSEEMMAYFVNYEVGTKWIYRDTLDANNFDTVELISKKHFDVTDGTSLKKGYELYYKPIKSKDFKVWVSPGVNNTYFVKVDPMVTAAGAVSFENYNGEWADWITYYDSIEIKTEKYYQVISSLADGGGYSFVHVSKNNGIVYFTFRDYTGGISKGGNYHLIKTIKP